MSRLLADVNAEGYLAALVRGAQSGGWREIWDSLGVEVRRFADVGLPLDAPDDVVWQLCQDRECLLVTANRNQDGPTSLESVIRDRGVVTSLPILTFADAPRLAKDREYLDAAIAKVVEVMSDFDLYRGTGRLFVP